MERVRLLPALTRQILIGNCQSKLKLGLPVLLVASVFLYTRIYTTSTKEPKKKAIQSQVFNECFIGNLNCNLKIEPFFYCLIAFFFSFSFQSNIIFNPATRAPTDFPANKPLSIAVQVSNKVSDETSFKSLTIGYFYIWNSQIGGSCKLAIFQCKKLKFD